MFYLDKSYSQRQCKEPGTQCY